MSNEIFVLHKFGELSSKKIKESSSVQYLQQYRKVTIILSFRHYCWIPSCKALSGNWTVLLFWGANQFHTLNGFLNMENVKILPYKVPKYQKIHFGGTSGYWMSITYLHTPTKSSLAVIVRGQPSFYDHWFTRYRFCQFFALPGLFPGYFRLTDHDPKYGTYFFWLS